MTEFNPPYAPEKEGVKHPAQLFRQALAMLLGPAGGVSQRNALEVTPHAPAEMKVIVNGGAPPLGQILIPGTTIAGTQGLYYCWNNAPVTKAIGASNETNPRVDTVVAQVLDSEYAGGEDKWQIVVLAGKPEPGVTLENKKGAAAVPASSIVLAYVLVPAKATVIEAADIEQNTTLPIASVDPLEMREANANTEVKPGELIKATAGITVTLPAPVKGATVEVFAESGETTVKQHGADTISGDYIAKAATIVLPQNYHVRLVSDGVNWFITSGRAHLAQVYTAQASTASGEEHEPSSTHATLVVLEHRGSSLSMAVYVNAELIAELIDHDAASHAASFSFIVPAGQKWHAIQSVIEGTPKIYYSYLPLPF